VIEGESLDAALESALYEAATYDEAFKAVRRTLADPSRARIRREIGDAGILLLLLCERTQFNLLEATEEKIELNEAKYPTHEARGAAEAPR
jgi:hypothetical protein